MSCPKGILAVIGFPFFGIVLAFLYWFSLLNKVKKLYQFLCFFSHDFRNLVEFVVCS